MLLINDNWEQVNTIEDGIKIIEDNMGKEFAQKFVEVLLNAIDDDSYYKRQKAKTKMYNYIGVR